MLNIVEKEVQGLITVESVSNTQVSEDDDEDDEDQSD